MFYAINVKSPPHNICMGAFNTAIDFPDERPVKTLAGVLAAQNNI